VSRSRKHRQGRTQTLAGKASRALGLSFTNNAVAKLGTAGVAIVLARLLGPQQFGIYAVAYVALRVLISLNDLGVSLAIVRWPGDPAEITSTVTTIAVTGSVVLYAGCYFGAPWYAAAMGAPAATGVVRVSALAVLIDALAGPPAALLQRAFRQDLRLIVDQANVWLGTGLTLLLAFSGFGAMSLAVGRLVGTGVALVLFLIFSPQPPRLGFNRKVARPLLKFGVPLAGSGVVVFAIANVDQLVAGRTLGVTALGYFVLASNLSNWPLTMFSQPVRNVAPATFARIRDSNPGAMRGGFLSAAGLLAAVTVPACLVLSGSAGPVVSFLYGARWHPAAQPLMWLALLTALQIFFELSYDYFVVLGRSRVVFTMQLVWLIVLVPALVAGARWHGVWGLALAEACVAAGLTLPWYLRELRVVGIGTRALARRMRIPLLAATLAGLAAFAAARLLRSDVTALTVSGLVWLLIVGALGYHLRADLKRLRRRGTAPAPAPVPATAPAPAVTLEYQVPSDSTGPIPLPVPIAPVPAREAEMPPLYLATVRSLRWDPALDTRDHGRRDHGELSAAVTERTS
jgi:PST family polysaccharide transporter